MNYDLELFDKHSDDAVHLVGTEESSVISRD